MSDARIYFIKSAHSAAVKIGVAEDPRKRLSSLQTGSIRRLSIIAEMPGDERYESVLHLAFAEFRIRGEWFRCEGRLASFISVLPAMYPIEAEAPRFRQKIVVPKRDERGRRYVDRVLLPAIRDAVNRVGFHRFAAAVELSSGNLARALNQRGRYFLIDHLLVLMAMCDEETALRLANIFCAPLNARAFSVEQTAQERAAAERLTRLRDGVIATLGPVDGRAFLDSFDAEIAAENARRLELFESDPWAFAEQSLSAH